MEILDLPEEMLSLIFSKVVDLVGRTEFSNNVMPVCRTFRDLALADSRLWTDLHSEYDLEIFAANGTLGFVRRLTVDSWSNYGILFALEDLRICKGRNDRFNNLVIDSSFSRCRVNLTDLRLKNLSFFSDGLSAVLAPVIEKLETLELCNLKMYDRENQEDLGPILDLNATFGGRLKSPTLQNIHVSFDGIGPNLSVLVLDNVYVNGYIRFITYACLSRLLERCEFLTDLILKESVQHYSLSELVSQKCPRLERLEVAGLRCREVDPLFDVGQVLTRCKYIRKLDLNRVKIDASENSTTSSGLTHLRIKSSFENREYNSRNLAFEEYHYVVRSSWMSALLSRCSNLRVLDLSELRMRDGDTWTSVIADNCGQQLTTLRLADISDCYGFSCFDLDRLLGRFTRLFHLSLKFVFIKYRSSAKSTSLRCLELICIDPFTSIVLESAVLPLLETHGSQLESIKFGRFYFQEEQCKWIEEVCNQAKITWK